MSSFADLPPIADAAAVAVRPMAASDVPAMLRVQEACYAPHLNEPADVLLARWRACPDTAWVAVAPATDEAVAYLVAYRSRANVVTPLGKAFQHDGGADALYLHDMAVSPAARGQGAASRLLATAVARARRDGLRTLALVAVNDTVAYWRKQGFREHASLSDSGSNEALASYAVPAVYMTTDVAMA